METESHQAPPRTPYVGLRPFTDFDRELFFGRDREAQDLLSLIVAHPAVLLYAPSGAGKTSLLQARVLPLLRERDARVLGTARVRGAVPEQPVENVFLWSALTSLLGAPPQPERVGKGCL